MYGILRERFAAISWEDDFLLGFYYCSLCHGLRENFRAVRVRFDKYKAENFDFGKKNPSE